MSVPREKYICGHSGKVTIYKPWEKSAREHLDLGLVFLSLLVCGTLLGPPKLTKTVAQVVKGRTKTQSYILIIHNISPNK